MCDYFHCLFTQEALDYPLEYASIFHVQKLNQVHLANSTKRNYQGPLQFDIVYTYFYSR